MASAVLEFILGPLLENPQRVGKPLSGRYKDQYSARCGPGYRVRYTIDDTDDVVAVLDISRRADVYGTD